MIFITPYQGGAKGVKMLQSATDLYFFPSNTTKLFSAGESVGTKYEARPLVVLKALRERPCPTQFQ
jgi:hypothetical protein